MEGQDMEGVNMDHCMAENKEIGEGEMVIRSLSLFSTYCLGAALASPLASLAC